MGRLILFAAAAALVCLPVHLVSAEITITGTTSSVALGDGVIADGTLSGANPSDFNNNFLVWTTGQATATTSDADAISLSELDLISIAGTQYLRFALDNQEAGAANAQVTITDLIINVYDVTDTSFSSPTVLWDFNNTGSNNIVVNDDVTATTLTLTPLGNGADVAFLIPRSLFDGTAFVGEDKLKVTVSGLSGGANDRENGAEEIDAYTGGDAIFVGANELLGMGAVPEPCGMILFGTAIGLVFFRRRK